jgi:integral membrane protein TerC family protein
MDWLAEPQVWAGLFTLTLLEVVLGIDNLIFVSLVAARLPPARQVGLMIALGMRLALLVAISWIMRLTAPLFTVAGHEVSWRDLILIGGGLFLLYKGTQEIHARIEGGAEHDAAGASRRASFWTNPSYGFLRGARPCDAWVAPVELRSADVWRHTCSIGSWKISARSMISAGRFTRAGKLGCCQRQYSLRKGAGRRRG